MYIFDINIEVPTTGSLTYKGQRRRPLVPYWNNDCREAVKVRNRKRAIYWRLRCESSFEEYKRAKGHAQWIIKSAKRDCWQKHCASFDGSTGLATLWRTIKGLNGNCSGPQIPPIASDSGNPLGDTEKAEMLARSFALSSSNADLSPHFAHIKTQHQLNSELFLPDDSSLSDPMSISEIHDALRRCGNSSPGPDSIHYEMLRRLPLLSLEGILALFNQSWSSVFRSGPPFLEESYSCPNLKERKATLTAILLLFHLSDFHSLQTPGASDCHKTQMVPGQ